MEDCSLAKVKHKTDHHICELIQNNMEGRMQMGQD